MLRWTIAVLNISYVPPHPAQFQKLLGIQMSGQPKYTIRDVTISETTEKVQNQLLTSETDTIEMEPLIQVEVGDYWKNMKPEETEGWEKALEKVLEMKKKHLSQTGTYYRKIYPRFVFFFVNVSQLSWNTSRTRS
jgi:hypothetical protein